MEVATLAGGCFWCLEAVFNELEGVENVVPGYSGGRYEDPAYEEVSTGKTGHAEVVQVTFAQEAISFRDILDVFFSVHDPTTLNRQGDDIGTQYRSAIFYHDEAQKEAADRVIRELDASKTWNYPVVTEVTPFKAFYPAEDSHHNYYSRNNKNPYCRLIIDPKIDKFRKKYSKRLKK